MSVERFMQQIGSEERGASVPAASAVWWRLEFRRRFEAERRATRPIRIAAAAAYAGCVIAAAVLSARFGPVVPIAVGVYVILTVAGAARALRSNSR
jgi:fatty acid desaturase